jgi:tetratricopeptide (TPR) repeat protein
MRKFFIMRHPIPFHFRTLLLILTFLPATNALALYARVETETVPTERLLANLEKRLASKPVESDLIKPGEEINIWSRNRRQGDGDHTVQSDGSVTVPDYGKIKVAGRTPAEAQKDLNSGKRKGVYLRQSWQQRKWRLLPGETATLHYELARVYSIASAQDPRTFLARKGGDRPFLGFGPSSGRPPRKNKARNAAPAGKRPVAPEPARQYLENAVKHFKLSLELKKDHLPAQLGLAWCLDQLGRKEAAVESYSGALDLAWAMEKKRNHIFGISWVEEISGYLVPLLDPVKDAKELSRIAKYRRAIGKKGRAVTPILVPLRSNARFDDLIDAKASVAFDLDGSGLDRRWGWITPEAAWLVHDPRQRGEITSGLQLFGNVTFWIFWKNGYEALGSLDDDGDGALTGSELKGLALWRDVNSNGRSEPGEVTPVADAGVVSLSTHSSQSPGGILFSPDGVTFRDGGIRPTYDWLAPLNLSKTESPATVGRYDGADDLIR